MKQSDLEFLLKFENIETNNHKRILQELIQQKQNFIDTCDAMNQQFIVSRPDIQSAPYLRFRAIEHIRMQQKIQELDAQIEQTQEHIRQSVKEEKKYDILKQEMITHAKKQHEKQQEDLVQEYITFKYSKPS